MRTWTAALATSTLLALGCGAIDRAADCTKICDKHKECSDPNYNVSNCVDYCTTQAKSDASYGQKVNDCSACIETRACNQIATSCTLSCPSLP